VTERELTIPEPPETRYTVPRELGRYIRELEAYASRAREEIRRLTEQLAAHSARQETDVKTR